MEHNIIHLIVSFIIGMVNIIHEDGTSEYYVYGMKVSKQEWVEKKNGIESIDE